MHTPNSDPFRILNNVMIAGIVPFAFILLLDLALVVWLRSQAAGTAGGGDGLLLAFLSIAGYVLACVVLVPCILYFLFLVFGRRHSPNLKTKMLLAASVAALAFPPLLINLLPLLR
jgi:hypothetical protein